MSPHLTSCCSPKWNQTRLSCYIPRWERCCVMARGTRDYKNSCNKAICYQQWAGRHIHSEEADHRITIGIHYNIPTHPTHHESFHWMKQKLPDDSLLMNNLMWPLEAYHYCFLCPEKADGHTWWSRSSWEPPLVFWCCEDVPWQCHHSGSGVRLMALWSLLVVCWALSTLTTGRTQLREIFSSQIIQIDIKRKAKGRP